MLKYLISITKDDDQGRNPYAGFAGPKLVVFAIDSEFSGLVDNTKVKMLLKLQARELVKCLCKVIEPWSNYTAAYPIDSDAIMTSAQLGIRDIVEEIAEAFSVAVYCYNQDVMLRRNSNTKTLK